MTPLLVDPETHLTLNVHILTHTHTHTHTLVLPRYRTICITIIVSLYHDILCVTISINEQLAWCSDISQTHRVIQRALKQTGEVHAYMVFQLLLRIFKKKDQLVSVSAEIRPVSRQEEHCFVSQYCVHITIYRVSRLSWQH